MTGLSISSEDEENRNHTIANLQEPTVSKLRSPPKRESSSRWKKRSRKGRLISSDVDESLLENGMFASSMSDDLFLYMMRFVVSETGDVDGTTLRSMSAVCKQWYGLVNASSLWSSSCTDSSSFGIASPLIGYRKLERLSSLWKNNSTFRVAERATEQVYVVRILDQKSPEALRHVSYTHELVGDDHLWKDAPQELKGSVVFPLRIELSGDESMVFWYEDCEQSFQHWFDTSDRCVNPTSDGDPPSILPVPLEQLKDWLRQLLKAFTVMENRCILPHSYTWAKPENIFMDKNGLRLRLLLPEIATTAEPLEQSSDLQSWSRGTDLFIVGAIFSLVARSGKEPSITPKDETAYVQWLKHEFPALNDSGVDFLRTLVDRELRDHVNPRPKRYTASEALSHPFLAVQDLSVDPLPPKVSMLKRKISIESEVQPNRRHAEEHEWAALVDWLVEICLVFEMSELAAFRAMSYFDRLLSKSTNPLPPCKYQTLAGACLLIASKVTGNVAITPSDLANCADNMFEAEELMVYAKFCEEALRWRLTPPTSLEFAMTISQATAYNPREHAVHWCISVLVLQTQLYRTYPPSVVGAAATVVAKYCLRQPLWGEYVTKETGLSLADLQAPVSRLCADIDRILSTMPDLKAIARSFCVENFGLRSIPRLLDLEHYHP